MRSTVLLSIPVLTCRALYAQITNTVYLYCRMTSVHARILWRI